MVKGNSVCIKVYLKPELFAEMVLEAEKAGIRRKGLLLYTQKPHGFMEDKLANTDGIAKYLKFCHKYRKESEVHILEEAAELARQEKEIAERKKQLGLG